MWFLGRGVKVSGREKEREREKEICAGFLVGLKERKRREKGFAFS